MTIICFLGEDSVGKTTLTHLLVDYLQSKGFKVRRAWMRGSHTIASLVSRFLSNFQVFRWTENPYYGISIPSQIVSIWWLIEYVSVIPVLLTHYLIPNRLGRTVLADRYVVDFIVWVTLITSDPSFKKSIYARHLLGISRRNTIKFYITASDEEIRRRSKEKIMCLSEQKRLYTSLARDAYKINTTLMTPQESLKQIITILQSLEII